MIDTRPNMQWLNQVLKEINTALIQKEQQGIGQPETVLEY